MIIIIIIIIIIIVLIHVFAYTWQGLSTDKSYTRKLNASLKAVLNTGESKFMNSDV